MAGTGIRTLNVGANAVTITVTAEDGTTTMIYNINVIRASSSASADARLSALSITDVDFIGYSFDPDIYEYEARVLFGVDNITVNATAIEAGSTIAGDGAYALNVGENLIDIVVTAPDEATTVTYTIIVIRNPSVLDHEDRLVALTATEGTLTPTFDPDIRNYTLQVAAEVETVTITATPANANATVTGDGEQILTLGSNIVTIIVKAEDGISIATYTITIIRGSNEGEDVKVPNQDSTKYINLTKETLEGMALTDITAFKIDVPTKTGGLKPGAWKAVKSNKPIDDKTFRKWLDKGGVIYVSAAAGLTADDLKNANGKAKGDAAAKAAALAAAEAKLQITEFERMDGRPKLGKYAIDYWKYRSTDGSTNGQWVMVVSEKGVALTDLAVAATLEYAWNKAENSTDASKKKDLKEPKDFEKIEAGIGVLSFGAIAAGKQAKDTWFIREAPKPKTATANWAPASKHKAVKPAGLSAKPKAALKNGEFKITKAGFYYVQASSGSTPALSIAGTPVILAAGDALWAAASPKKPASAKADLAP
jgi:hypothetical protein